MREVNMGDGKILHMPDTVQRVQDPNEGVWCDCHKRMGNDFYFLPTGSCIRNDKRCTNARPSTR